MKNLLLVSNLEEFEPKLEQVFDSLPDMKMIYIPTAAYAEDNYDWLEPQIEPLKKRCKSFDDFDLTGKTPEQTREALEDADIIYVTGGNTYYLLEQVQKTKFADALKKPLSKGVWYVGGSAGAALACPSIDYIEQMDDPSKATLRDFTGLGLVDFFVMPHIDHDKHGQQARKIIAQMMTQKEIIIGLRDDQALKIRQNSVEIF